uniref:Uncharacterized protein n=1 Tax=Arundo donax TaxID=35708 RepID=A0A0A9H684_ARUDO
MKNSKEIRRIDDKQEKKRKGMSLIPFQFGRDLHQLR